MTAPARVPLVGARAGRRLLVPLALLLAPLLAPLLALSGCGTAARPAASSARPAASGYPTYLPKDTLNYHSDTTATGTVQRPP